MRTQTLTRSAGLALPLTAAAIVWLLVGPRIELLLVAGSSIRLEDFVLVALWVRVARSWRAIREQRLVRQGISRVVVVSLIATGLAAAVGRVELVPSLFYALRPLEYWVIYPAIALVRARDPYRTEMYVYRSLVIVTALNAVVAALQFLGGYQLGFSKFSIDRGAGLSAGPYELGAICAMLACYWVYKRRYGLFLVSLATLLMSQSRASLLGLGIGALVLAGLRLRGERRRSQGNSKRRGKPKPAFVAASTAVLVAAILISPMALGRVVLPSLERIGTTSLSDSWDQAAAVVGLTPHQPTSRLYAATAYGAINEDILESTSSTDASNVVRFYRWQLLIREVVDSPQGLILGLGPSFAGPSVDGAMLRIFVESGALGLLAWSVLAFSWVRRRPAWMIAAVTTLLVGSMFIDLLFAMRPMLLLWVLCSLSDIERNDDRSVMGTQVEFEVKD